MTLSILCFNKSSVIFNRVAYKMKNLEKKRKVQHGKEKLL